MGDKRIYFEFILALLCAPLLGQIGFVRGVKHCARPLEPFLKYHICVAPFIVTVSIYDRNACPNTFPSWCPLLRA